MKLINKHITIFIILVAQCAVICPDGTELRQGRQQPRQGKGNGRGQAIQPPQPPRVRNNHAEGDFNNNFTAFVCCCMLLGLSLSIIKSYVYKNEVFHNIHRPFASSNLTSNTTSIMETLMPSTSTSTPGAQYVMNDSEIFPIDCSNSQALQMPQDVKEINWSNVIGTHDNKSYWDKIKQFVSTNYSAVLLNCSNADADSSLSWCTERIVLKMYLKWEGEEMIRFESDKKYHEGILTSKLESLWGWNSVYTVNTVLQISINLMTVEYMKYFDKFLPYSAPTIYLLNKQRGDLLKGLDICHKHHDDCAQRNANIFTAYAIYIFHTNIQPKLLEISRAKKYQEYGFENKEEFEGFCNLLVQNIYSNKESSKDYDLDSLIRTDERCAFIRMLSGQKQLQITDSNLNEKSNSVEYIMS